MSDASPSSAQLESVKGARPLSSPRLPHVWTAMRWEIRKLLSLKRTYVGLVAAALLPVAFVIILSIQGRNSGPRDLALAQANLHHTGLIVTLIMLFFTAAFAAPLVVSLVPSDIVGHEDAAGTLKMLLTRSVSRGQVLVAKMLAAATYVIACLLALAVAGIVAGTIAWGFHPLHGLDGQTISAASSLGLNFAAVLVYALPMLAVAAFAFMLSTVVRNGAAAIVMTIVYSLVQEALHGLFHGHWTYYLLSARYTDWEGLFYRPTHWSDIIAAIWISAVYAAVPLTVSYLFFLRRDVAADG